MVCDGVGMGGVDSSVDDAHVVVGRRAVTRRGKWDFNRGGGAVTSKTTCMYISTTALTHIS